MSYVDTNELMGTTDSPRIYRGIEYILRFRVRIGVWGTRLVHGRVPKIIMKMGTRGPCFRGVLKIYPVARWSCVPINNEVIAISRISFNLAILLLACRAWPR